MLKRLTLLVGLAGLLLAPPAHAQDPNTVRYVLQIPDGCYPVAINQQTEAISTVCRGQSNFSPIALQTFNQQYAFVGYQNTTTISAGRLSQDMRDGVGPIPWFRFHWLPELDRLRVWRPR